MVYIFFILLIAVIYRTNLAGDFFLTGWDNLHPEFDYKVNINRALFSAWQEYQGLGLPAGNAHAAELFKELISVPFSYIIPIQESRKVFFMVMLYLGPVGVYMLLKYVFFKHSTLVQKSALAVIGGLIYIFHIATIQIFYTPYEAFGAHYAFIPWMVFSVLLYLDKKTNSRLFFLFIVHIVGSMQFYIPTLFLVYAPTITVIIVVNLVSNQRPLNVIKHGIILLGIILIANLYWLLPFYNYTISNIGSQINSYLNLMYNDDIYFKNLHFGTLQNTIFIKGFLFDYIGTMNGKPDYLFALWRQHALMPFFSLWGIFLFGITVLGFTKSFFNKDRFAICVLFILFFGLLAIDTPPFNLINGMLRKNPLFHQVFRNPFTKFANMLLFFETLLFVFGLQYLLRLFEKGDRFSRNLIQLCALIFILCGSLLYLFPLWQGGLVYPTLRTAIPKEYFDLFSFFRNKPNERIANLPQTSNDGWYSYNWNYNGSGFLWYGIKQPILDRAFDVWNQENENYYWEISQALYSNNINAIQNVLEKYQIRWIVLDRNILTGSSPKSTYINKLEELFNKNTLLHLERNFGNISVYRVNLNIAQNGFVITSENLPIIQPPYDWNNIDTAFDEYGHYISYTNANMQDSGSDYIYYPFRSLFTGRNQSDLEFSIRDEKTYIAFTSFIPQVTKKPSYLSIPGLSQDDITAIGEEIDATDSSKLPSVYINKKIQNNPQAHTLLTYESRSEQRITVRIPKTDSIPNKKINPALNKDVLNAKTCNPFYDGLKTNEIISKNNAEVLRLTSQESSNCIVFEIPDLSHRYAYAVKINYKNISGKGLLVSLLNQTSKHMDMQQYLPSNGKQGTAWLIITPKDYYGLGYSLHFDNISLLSHEKTINDLGLIEIFPIPLTYLKSIKVITPGQNQSLDQIEPNKYSIFHPDPNIYWYQIQSTKSNNSQYLTLAQTFDKGWAAFEIPKNIKPSHLNAYLAPFYGKKISDHLKIDNWANGWQINNTAQNIVIIYIPQYFQFAGIVLLLLTLILLSLGTIKQRKHHIHNPKENNSLIV